MARPPQLTVEASMKHLFFDRHHVHEKVGEANARAMAKALAFIKRTAQTSMRRGKGSKPGKPPHRKGHKGEGLGRILFFFNDYTQSGVVGPLRYGSQSGIAHKSTAPTVPNQAEFGGVQTFRLLRFDKQGNSIDPDGTALVKSTRKRDKGARVRKTAKPHRYRFSPHAPPIRIRVKARPFMSRALEKETEKGNILAAWGNEVHE